MLNRFSNLLGFTTWANQSTLGRAELKNTLLSDKSSPNYLYFETIHHNDFFEPGAGGTDQIFKDFDRIGCQFVVKDNAEELASFYSKQDFVNDKRPATLARYLATKLYCDIEIANQIISAHSQGPSAFIPFYLSDKILNPTDYEDDNFVIKQPEKIMNKIENDNGMIKLSFIYPSMPVQSCMETEPAGFINGPITTTYILTQKNNQWGWQLEAIQSDNADIMLMMRGNKLSLDYVRQTYFGLTHSSSTQNEKMFDETKETPAVVHHLSLSNHSFDEDKSDNDVFALASRPVTSFTSFHKNEDEDEKKHDSEYDNRLSNALLDNPNALSRCNSKDLINWLVADDSEPSQSIVDHYQNQAQHDAAIPMHFSKKTLGLLTGASVLATGAAISSTLICLGVISIAALAAIPVVGWGILAGASLLVGMYTAWKAVTHFSQHRTSSTLSPELQEPLMAKPSTILPASAQQYTTLQRQNITFDFSSQQSALQKHSLMNRNHSIADESDFQNQIGRRHTPF